MNKLISSYRNYGTFFAILADWLCPLHSLPILTTLKSSRYATGYNTSLTVLKTFLMHVHTFCALIKLGLHLYL